MKNPTPTLTGHYIVSTVFGEEVKAYVPLPLTHIYSALEIDEELETLTSEANRALAALELIGQHTLSHAWVIFAISRKEAVDSSKIEGSKATIDELYKSEASPTKKTNPDTEDLSNYIYAQDYAWKEMSKPKGGLPLSMRLLNCTHKRLMEGGTGENRQPGEIRRSPVWIGGSRPSNATYVPPQINQLPDLLKDLELHYHKPDALPPLVRVGLIHAQFEMIHPYLDGNGRIGRMLIPLLLNNWQLLDKPVLYLSSFFNNYREEYYTRLKSISTDGDWKSWLLFFLRGVKSSADEAVVLIVDLMKLVNNDRTRLRDSGGLPASALRLFEFLPQAPIISVSGVKSVLGVSAPSATRAIEALMEMGILSLTTMGKRNRFFAYTEFLDMVGGIEH